MVSTTIASHEDNISDVSTGECVYCLLCRLASGDNEGRVVIWDVSSGTAVASLEDPLSAAQSPGPVARKTEPGKGGAVRGLVWIISNPCVLGIVLNSGMFLVWDPQGSPLMCQFGTNLVC